MTTTPHRATEVDLIDVPAGLAGVAAAETRLGDVRGQEGFFHYRQYSAIDLAQQRSLEDVWFLLLEGELPTADQREAFAAEIAGAAVIPDEVARALPLIATAGAGRSLLPRLRTALSLLASVEDLQPVWGADPQARRRDAIRVAAITPTLLASLHRLRQGLEPVAPQDGLSAAGQWLHLLGLLDRSDADARDVEAIDRYLIATVDHGFNASTFTARVTASAGSGVASAVCGGIGTFVGPLHGGAPDRALDALDEIGSPERIEPWVRARIESGDRIMGFGHAIYRTQDPRAAMLREMALARGGALADFAAQVETQVLTLLAELKPDRVLHTNVEFWAGVIMEQCGLSRDLFTPTFAVSRVIGWTANILEQAQGSKIIRPSARYVGPPAHQPVP